MLVGKIISAYGSTVPVDVISAFDKVFSGSSSTITMFDVANMRIYETNAEAIAGGVGLGVPYRTATGHLMVRY